MKDIYVLDACALIALLESEKGADKVEDIYIKSVNRKAIVVMNKVNLFEVYYGFYRERGKEYAVNTLSAIQNSSIIISEFSYDIFAEAGRLKAKYKISLADSIALAQAVVTDGSLLTADHHEFDIIEQSDENIKFCWIR
jgi:PIN domain nuclease of toxin-antitoxin system